MNRDHRPSAGARRDGAQDRIGDHDLTFFDPPAIDRVLGMVLELASQLNEERYRRMALESALAGKGLLQPGDVEAEADNDSLTSAAQREVSDAVARLMQPIVSDGHPSRPLRPRQAPDQSQ